MSRIEEQFEAISQYAKDFPEENTMKKPEGGNHKRSYKGAGLTVELLAPYVGRDVQVRYQKVLVNMRVLEASLSWGQPKFLCTPLAGSGEQWIELCRVVGPAKTPAAAPSGASPVVLPTAPPETRPRKWDE